MQNKLFFVVIKILSFLPYKFLNMLVSMLNYTIGKGYFHAGFKSLKNEVNCVSKILKKKPSIIFDIGARLGEYSEYCLKIYPNASYYLFEPCKKNYEYLINKFKNFSNVKIYNYALSSTNKDEIILYSNYEGSGYASLLKRNLSHRNINMQLHKEIVKAITLKKFVIDNKIESIDICKIDVEGAEMDVLKGISEFIKKIKIIQFEISSGQMELGQYFRDFWLFFSKNNFKLHIVTPSGPKLISRYKERDEFFDETNYLATNL